MASQQYSLRWNNYVRHMTSAFESLRSDRDLIDVTLSCEGKKIPAHKMLLSACSSYFKDLFKENPCQHPVIIFRNVTFDDLMALVDFMYNGEVNVEQEQLASFLNTAELLQVQGLTNSKDQEKSKKTAKEDDRVPATSQFDEDGEERSSTPTKAGPPAAKKRKWQSPSRTESPATVSELPAAQGSADGDGDEDVQSIDQVPLKTETPDYDDDDDLQGSGAEDTPDEHEIVQKLQKSDQLVLTSSRNRTSNSEHSLYGNNSMDMDSGDMSSFVMAGPSNESMGQEGMQGCMWRKERKTKVFETENGTYQCSECGTLFMTKNQAYYHFYHKHSELNQSTGRVSKVLDLKNGLFVCSVCGLNFETKSKAYYHTRCHELKSDIVCGLCKRTFSSMGNLHQHIRNFHQFGH